MDLSYIQHHGIKGMRWGVRRYQNKDGTLTEAGKKRISKEYKKASVKVAKSLNKNYMDMYVKAHNRAIDDMERDDATNKFNTAQEKKYGKNFTDRDGYVDDYNALFNTYLTKQLNKSLNDFYNNNSDLKKAKNLVDKYDMTKWDNLAKDNEEAIASVRRAVEENR